MTQIIKVGTSLREANDSIAAENRAVFSSAGVKVINMMSSPGAGKTTLIEETIRRLAGKTKIGVIEGDIATAKDGERVKEAGAEQVIQINTEGGCHLDAQMVKSALDIFPLENLDIVIIENVGNLVCPTEFDLGEDYRVMLASVTEGEDKPKKYPGMYLAAETLVLNKTDLVPYINVSAQTFISEAKEVNPHLQVFQTSATKGDGMDVWCEWLLEYIG